MHTAVGAGIVDQTRDNKTSQSLLKSRASAFAATAPKPQADIGHDMRALSFQLSAGRARCWTAHRPPPLRCCSAGSPHAACGRRSIARAHALWRRSDLNDHHTTASTHTTLTPLKDKEVDMVDTTIDNKTSKDNATLYPKSSARTVAPSHGHMTPPATSAFATTAGIGQGTRFPTLSTSWISCGRRHRAWKARHEQSQRFVHGCHGPSPARSGDEALRTSSWVSL